MMKLCKYISKQANVTVFLLLFSLFSVHVKCQITSNAQNVINVNIYFNTEHHTFAALLRGSCALQIALIIIIIIIIIIIMGITCIFMQTDIVANMKSQSRFKQKAYETEQFLSIYAQTPQLSFTHILTQTHKLAIRAMT